MSVANSRAPITRIGLTMRISEESEYTELRDSLDKKWGAFMTKALPEVYWGYIPNLGHSIVDWFRSWGFEGLILTGGEDIGDNPDRDLTEEALLDYCVSKQIPILGVCRGCQFIADYFSDNEVLSLIDNHVSTRHEVIMSTNFGSRIQLVNSFHRYGIDIDKLTPELVVTAKTLCGQWAEGIDHNKYPISGIMWHPERESDYAEIDIELFRHRFGR